MSDILDKIESLTEKFDPNKYQNLDDEWRRLLGWHNYYRWLWAAVTVLEPQNLVEVGRERGVSATIMLDAMKPDARLSSIDIVEEAIFLKSVTDSRLSCHTVDSLRFVEHNIDFLFLDGEHTKERIEREWAWYSPMLVPNATVVFDDIHFDDGMSQFWESLAGNKYELPQWHERGFGVLFL